MANEHNSATPQRASKRRIGQHMNATERKTAQQKFLDVFAKTSNILAACQSIGIDRSTAYRWKEQSADFKDAFDLANQDASDRLYAEAWQRAMKGEEEYVVSAGKIVYGPNGQPLTKRVKSDRLLELMLKARITEFRTNAPIITNPDAQPVEPQHGLYIANYDYATEDELTTIQDIQTAINARKEEAEQGKIVQIRRIG